MTEGPRRGEIAGLAAETGALAAGALADVATTLIAPFSKAARAVGLLAGDLDIPEIAGNLKKLTELSLNAASAIDELSRQTSIGPEQLQELQFAFDVSGPGSGQLDDALTRLQSSAGSVTLGLDDTTIKAFDAIGLDATNIGSLDTAGLFEEVLSGLSTIEDRFQRAVLAAQIFGEGIGAGLLPLVDEGPEGLERLADEARTLGAVWDRHILSNAAETNREFRGLSSAIDAELAQAFVALGPGLNTGLRSFLELARAASSGVDRLRSDVDASTDELLRRLETIGEDIAPGAHCSTNGRTRPRGYEVRKARIRTREAP